MRGITRDMHTQTGYALTSIGLTAGTDLERCIHEYALGGRDEEVDVTDVALGVVLGVGHLDVAGGGRPMAVTDTNVQITGE